VDACFVIPISECYQIRDEVSKGIHSAQTIQNKPFISWSEGERTLFP
jgi:hypothetical protein